MEKGHILILGGDGYLGWPAAMRFSSLGYEVTAVDNCFRRRACAMLGIDFLAPVPAFSDRSALWKKKSNRQIRTLEADLRDAEILRSLFTQKGYELAVKQPWPGMPLAVLHLAEQPSAPYSQLDYEKTAFTVANNLGVTTNLLCAIRDFSPATRIVHIGTMGEYGTPNIDIEEGWLEIEHKDKKDRFLFPRQAGSVYHTTKIMDTDLMWFFVRTYDLAVTDLMQGPVYGMETGECMDDPSLRPYFNYDDIFGTVLNRFIVQAACGYPLTVYGKGGQTRGYININDTLQCLQAAVEHPANAGQLRIFNQITETFSVNELAQLVREAGQRSGRKVAINHVPNPRKELEEHYYNPKYTGLRDIGVTPHPLTTDTLDKMLSLACAHRDTVKREKIFSPLAGHNASVSKKDRQ